MTSSDLGMKNASQADAAALYQMSVEDISDRIKVMLHQESSSAYRPVDYLKYHRGLTEEEADEHWLARSKMCTWCCQLIDTCTLSRHAVMRAMNYLDRYLATASHRALKCFSDRREYQLAAMTALYISIKVHEPLAMEASLLSQISAGTYSARDILEMESDILRALRWKLHAPTSQEYVCLFLGLLDPQGFDHDVDVARCLLELASFQCELACCSYDLVANCKPSEVALGAILNCLEGIDESVLSNESRYAYLRRLCKVLTATANTATEGGGVGLDMVRVKRVEARLRRLFRENLPSVDDDKTFDNSRTSCRDVAIGTGKKTPHNAPNSPVSVVEEMGRLRRPLGRRHCHRSREGCFATCA